jgi:hypothetical protein
MNFNGLMGLETFALEAQPLANRGASFRISKVVGQPKNLTKPLRNVQPLARQSGSFLYRAATAIPRWMWNNKFKAVLIFVLLYVIRKCWRLYTTYVKPFMELMKGPS